MSRLFLIPARKLLFGRLVLIYQMPKIGSQTIETTLRDAFFPYPVRRLHYLSPTIASTVRRGVSSKRPDPEWKCDARQQLQSLREISRIIRIRKLFCALGGNIPKLEVISGVRELIGLVLSSIFENYLYFAPTIETMTVDYCRETLLRPKIFTALRSWFDLELKQFLGVDVFEIPFPYEQGYQVYENQFARVLVYRFDVLKKLPSLLQDFLQFPVPGLSETNIGSSKAYAKHYELVKNSLRLPSDLVKSLYEDKVMQHFYSDNERMQLAAKWAEQSDCGPRA